MATSEQVARLAGVSRATVSRVINGSSNVSEETKKRIYAAIATLGYGTNALTRATSPERSYMVALALFGSEEGLNFSQLADTQFHFYLELLSFIEHDIANAGYDLLLPSRPYKTLNITGDPATDYVLALQEKRVDGMLTMALHSNDPRIQSLCRSSIPTIFIDSLFQGEHSTYVKSDYMGGAIQATEHLLRLGHRRIAFFSGSLVSPTGTERLLGHQQAMARAGLVSDPQLLRSSGWETQEAYQEAMKMLSERRDFTAIFAASDMMAIGVLRALHEHGLRVPQDVSVIGFDGIKQSAYTNPPLTTIQQDMQAISTASVSRLLQLINGEEAPSSLIVPTKLVVRASTAPARTAM